MSERVLIDGGRRQGRTLQNEAKFREAIGDGKDVFTVRNGVWFAITLDGDVLIYTALISRPEGV